MDFVPLIDTIGEPQTLALAGLALGTAFGIVLERSEFCTRSAVLEAVSGNGLKFLPMWMLAFATAMIGVQLLLLTGQIDVSETRFFSTPQSLSGAAVGGGLFGIGMILARGCASRLIVLGASGNLRAIFTVAILAGTSWATYQGPLVPLRNYLAGLWSTGTLGTNDLANLTGFDHTGLAIGLITLSIAIIVSLTKRVAIWHYLAGALVGALIVAGWAISYALSTQVFDPIQAESLSYMRPLANSVNYAANGAAESYLSMDVGIISGTILGAFAASVVFRGFKLKGFSEPGTPHVLRYVCGGILMGFGGILAVGCTIGAGLTGTSVLAVNSLVALTAILGWGALTSVLIERISLKPKVAASLATAE